MYERFKYMNLINLKIDPKQAMVHEGQGVPYKYKNAMHAYLRYTKRKRVARPQHTMTYVVVERS